MSAIKIELNMLCCFSFLNNEANPCNLKASLLGSAIHAACLRAENQAL